MYYCSCKIQWVSCKSDKSCLCIKEIATQVNVTCFNNIRLINREGKGLLFCSFEWGGTFSRGGHFICLPFIVEGLLGCLFWSSFVGIVLIIDDSILVLFSGGLWSSRSTGHPRTTGTAGSARIHGREGRAGRQRNGRKRPPALVTESSSVYSTGLGRGIYDDI